MYAILDIETTGGQFNEEGITEIAIYKFDGHEIVDQFISLINPEIPIQPFVIKLTGINNAMLRSAPKFFEVAKRIIEITSGCVIVAHNADFDYRILQTEFRRLGYDFTSKTLCTVALSKKLLLEQPSYSLGKLVRALGIPMTDRHRASGDALATVKLFKILLEKDIEKQVMSSFIKQEVKTGISLKWLDIIAHLPSKTGVYYIYNKEGILIYIGKSRNIKKRMNQHLTGVSARSKNIQKDFFSVTYEETGNELIALLKENEEIRINKPVYNLVRYKSPFNWALYSKKNQNGYFNLNLQKLDGRKKEIISFTTLQEGKNALFQIINQYQLCQKLTNLNQPNLLCFQYKDKKCDGTCVQKINVETYNKRVFECIVKNSFEHQNLILIDRGRTVNERSAILIEDGVYKGYAFYDLNYQLTHINILKNILIPMSNHREAKLIIQEQMRKSKTLKMVSF